MTRQVKLSPKDQYKVNELAAAAYFDSNKSNPIILGGLCKGLPKTCLHGHVEGGIWAEDFLKFASNEEQGLYLQYNHFHVYQRPKQWKRAGLLKRSIANWPNNIKTAYQ